MAIERSEPPVTRQSPMNFAISGLGRRWRELETDRRAQKGDRHQSIHVIAPRR